MRISIRIALAAIMWIVAGSTEAPEIGARPKDTPTIKGLEKIPDRDLREAVAKYYIGEAGKEWAKTYKFRRKAFHEVVLFQTYQRIMNEQTDGWTLAEVDVLGVRGGEFRLSDTNSPEVTFVQIRFLEILQKGHGRIKGIESTESLEDRDFVSIEETAWLTEDGEVKCLSCGTRGHVILNIPMRYD